MDDELDGLDESFDILDGSMETVYTGKVPGSLMALCILTLVGSAFILIKDFFSYYIFSIANSFNDGIRNSGAGIEEVNAFFDSLSIIYLAEVLSCLGTIAGAILMMRLKKIGFTIYVISTAVYGLAIVWYFFIVMQMDLNEFLMIMLLFYLAIPILFIILYAPNKRYLH